MSFCTYYIYTVHIILCNNYLGLFVYFRFYLIYFHLVILVLRPKLNKNEKVASIIYS